MSPHSLLIYTKVSTIYLETIRLIPQSTFSQERVFIVGVDRSIPQKLTISTRQN